MSRMVVSIWLSCGLSIMASPAWCAEERAEWIPGGDEFFVDVVRPRAGWAGTGSIAPSDWKPVSQPGLDEEIKHAPQLELTAVAPAPERCWVGHRPYLVPNPDGESWDMVYPYYNKYGGIQEVVIHDFGSGATRKQVLSTRTGDEVLTRERIDFHMQPSFYTDGKLVFEMIGPVMFLVYDPAVDAFTDGIKPFGEDVVNGRCVLGDDGMIYGMGWPRDKSGFVAYRFDPKSRKAERFQTFGPPNEHRRELYRDVRMFGDWIYAAIGSQPWHLVAFNFKTGEGRLLAATEAIIGDSDTINLTRMKGGLSGTMRNAAWVRDVDDFDGEAFRFWLHDGTILKRGDDTPPWSNAPAERDLSPRFDWPREYQEWPRGFVPPSPPPFIERDSADPDAQGHVAMRYRPGGGGQWKTLEYEVRMYPGVVRLLTEVNDHVLFATDEGYGQQVFYDLASKRLKRIGGTLSPYSIGFCDDRLYVSGYPNSQIIQYDFSRPLGLNRNPPNPTVLGFPPCDTHLPLGGTVGGGDRRVYNGGTTVERRRVGGGMGWFDTITGELGGIALDDHRIFWMTSAEDGRYIVLSSKCEGTGKLFVWDTQTHAFLHRIDPPQGGTRPGPIVEAMKGLVIGHSDDSQAGPLLYGFNPASGEILWTRPVPSPPVTALAQVRRHAYSFRRGPDGFIWAFFDQTLVRIDPRNAYITPVGRCEPAQLAFAMGSVYLAGGPVLRRIEGIAVGQP